VLQLEYGESSGSLSLGSSRIRIENDYSFSIKYGIQKEGMNSSIMTVLEIYTYRREQSGFSRKK
jgi:hypothetical protein